MTERAGIEAFRKSARLWIIRLSVYGTAHWTLGVLAIALSAVVATGLSTGAALSWEKCGAVITTSLVTFLGASDHLNRYLRAYRRLRLAIIRYDLQKGEFEDVEHAYLDAVTLLDQDYSSPTHGTRLGKVEA